MARQSVQYVLTKPAAPSWWKSNRHLVLFVAGLLIGAWLVGDHDSAASPTPDRTRPTQSATTGPAGTGR